MPPRKSSHAPEKTYTDFIQPFLIDHSAIRGRLVRVEKSLDKILRAHQYPQPVSLLLAEQIVLAALLSATLSDGGILTLQAKGDGPVRFVVVDVMAGGIIRGYAEVAEGAFQEKESKALTLAQLLGKGCLAVTFDQGGESQRYQGIVDLKGETLSDALRGYFVQSQQGEIAVHVAVSAPDKTHKKWRGAGIIIERMPLEGGKENQSSPEEQDDLWQRTKLFMTTLKDAEMLNPEVTPQNLLYRLFNEDGVWVYRLQPLKSGCRCSRARVRLVLKSLPEKELLEMLDEKGKMSIHCQFCNSREIFTRADIRRLYGKQTKPEKRSGAKPLRKK